MKKILAGILIIIMMLTFVSCGEEQTLTDDEGNMLKLSVYDITENGFYVLDKRDKTFTPIMGGAEMYGAQIENMLVDKETPNYLWVGNRDLNLMKLIPKVDGKNTFLVMVYDTQEEFPEILTLQKYKKLGYTVGAHVTYGQTGRTLYIDNTDRCTSSAADELLKKNSDGLLKIHTINGSKKLPYENIDTDVNMLLGLEKNKLYQIGYFDGTKHYEQDFIADTVGFKESWSQELSAGSIETEENYFIVNLLQNMEEGYYYINDAGMFKYGR